MFIEKHKSKKGLVRRYDIFTHTTFKKHISCFSIISQNIVEKSDIQVPAVKVDNDFLQK